MLGAAADAAAQYTDLAAAMCAFQILDPLSLRYLDRFVVFHIERFAVSPRSTHLSSGTLRQWLRI